jgi:hypothetical protein
MLLYPTEANAFRAHSDSDSVDDFEHDKGDAGMQARQARRQAFRASRISLHKPDFFRFSDVRPIERRRKERVWHLQLNSFDVCSTYTQSHNTKDVCIL